MTNRKRNNINRMHGLILTLALMFSWIILPTNPPVVATLVDLATPTAGAAARDAAQHPPDRVVTPDQATRTRVAEALGKLPLAFEANAGQTAEEVKFLARGPGYKLFLTANEAVMVLRGKHTPGATRVGRRHEEAKDVSTPQSTLRMKLVGANPRPRAQGQEKLSVRTNYFIGNDPQHWQTNVASYARVRYAGVYRGIDLVYYGNQRQLEYDF